MDLVGELGDAELDVCGIDEDAFKIGKNTCG